MALLFVPRKKGVEKDQDILFPLILWAAETVNFIMPLQGSKLKKMSGRKFATSYENLVATLKMLVAKLIEAI